MTTGLPGNDRPAADGGQPLFPDGLPLARPEVADPGSVADRGHRDPGQRRAHQRPVRAAAGGEGGRLPGRAPLRRRVAPAPPG